MNAAVLSKSRLRDEKIYDKAKYSELLLPIRAGGNWLLVLCLPGYQQYQVVVFDDWEWNAPDVQRMLERVTFNLKGVVVQT